MHAKHLEQTLVRLGKWEVWQRIFPGLILLAGRDRLGSRRALVAVDAASVDTAMMTACSTLRGSEALRIRKRLLAVGVVEPKVTEAAVLFEEPLLQPRLDRLALFLRHGFARTALDRLSAIDALLA